MEYFEMRQDPRVTSAAEPAGADVNRLRYMARGETSEASSPVNLYVKKSGRIEYPDCIENPVMLLSEKLKRVIGIYQKDAVFGAVTLIEKETNRQEIYYTVSAPRIGCASNETAYDARGKVKELVIDQEKAGQARVFFAEGNGQRLIVRLDVAESILRRDPYGVWFEKVKVKTKGGE